MSKISKAQDNPTAAGQSSHGQRGRRPNAHLRSEGHKPAQHPFADRPLPVDDPLTGRSYDVRPLFALAHPDRLGSMLELANVVRDGGDYFSGHAHRYAYSRIQKDWLALALDELGTALGDVLNSRCRRPAIAAPRVQVYDLVTLIAYDTTPLFVCLRDERVGGLEQLNSFVEDAAECFGGVVELNDYSEETQQTIAQALYTLADTLEQVHATAVVPPPPDPLGRNTTRTPRRSEARVLALLPAASRQPTRDWHRVARGSDGIMLSLPMPHTFSLPFAA